MQTGQDSGQPIARKTPTKELLSEIHGRVLSRELVIGSGGPTPESLAI
ncbi:MAG: hypothetical protein ACYDBP_07635 [Leptospirales bacterium]